MHADLQSMGARRSRQWFWSRLLPTINVCFLKTTFSKPATLAPKSRSHRLLSHWTKKPTNTHSHLAFVFCQWERVQSAFIPRSNDSTVVRACYWLPLCGTDGNMTPGLTHKFSPRFLHRAVMNVDVLDVGMLTDFHPLFHCSVDAEFEQENDKRH